MELRTTFNTGIDSDLDSELDSVGIILDSPMLCGNCMMQMDHVGKHLFRCPRCGMTYDDIAS